MSFLNIDYTVNTNLVRGLDYYTSTVFEFTTTDLGAQSTVLAGGRYDKLMKNMGGMDTPAVGFASGVERLMLLLENDFIEDRPVAIIPISENEVNYCLTLKNNLLNNSIKTELVYANNMKKKMNIANKIGVKYAIIVGEDEIKSNVLTVKNLDEGVESKIEIKVIINFIKK